MNCKHLFETNYAVWVCGKDESFRKLDNLGKYHAYECEGCQYYKSGVPSIERLEAFRKYDEADTKRIEEEEERYWGAD